MFLSTSSSARSNPRLYENSRSEAIEFDIGDGASGVCVFHSEQVEHEQRGIDKLDSRFLAGSCGHTMA